MLNTYKKKLKEIGEVYLSVKVRPGAAKSEVVREMGDGVLKINIAAPPVGGKANIELAKFMVKELGVRRDCVRIISGAGSRAKLIKIIKE